MDGVRSELTGEFNLAELKDFERAEPILPKGVAKTEANEVTLNIINWKKWIYYTLWNNHKKQTNIRNIECIDSLCLFLGCFVLHKAKTYLNSTIFLNDKFTEWKSLGYFLVIIIS